MEFKSERRWRDKDMSEAANNRLVMWEAYTQNLFRPSNWACAWTYISTSNQLPPDWALLACSSHTKQRSSSLDSGVSGHLYDNTNHPTSSCRTSVYWLRSIGKAHKLLFSFLSSVHWFRSLTWSTQTHCTSYSQHRIEASSWSDIIRNHCTRHIVFFFFFILFWFSSELSISVLSRRLSHPLLIWWLSSSWFGSDGFITTFRAFYQRICSRPGAQCGRRAWLDSQKTGRIMWWF